MLENSVAEYKERYVVCQTCKGSGAVAITKEEMMEIMDHTTIEHALKVYKQWRALEGSIDCADCSGIGEFTVRY